MAMTNIRKALEQAYGLNKASIQSQGLEAGNRAVNRASRSSALSGLSGPLAVGVATQAGADVEKMTQKSLTDLEASKLKSDTDLAMKEEELALQGEIADKEMWQSILGGVGGLIGEVAGSDWFGNLFKSGESGNKTISKIVNK